MSTWRIMRWLNTGTNLKSEEETNRLVKDVLLQPDFMPSELSGFNAQRENKRANMATTPSTTSPLSGFQETTVDIEVPSGRKNDPAKTFAVPGLHYRDLLSVIKEAFAHPLALKYHFSPFRLFHQPPGAEEPRRVHGELYTSDAFIEEHDRIQRISLPDNIECTRERVVAALMFWSDGTHLAQFGNAKLWPVYLMLGNLSKYIRSQPNSQACHHLAYIPSLPDSFEDWAKTFCEKWSSKSQKADIITHCRRELMHAVWRHLLTDEFIHAYKYGLLVMCADGVERRIFPRIFTYSADYPEKVLLATIRDKGLCPCPRCFIPKSKLDQLGADLRFRVSQTRTFLINKVNQARRLIYSAGAAICGSHVQGLLKESSSVPTLNAFVDRLGLDFQVSQMLVVDLMHEFELGVWKALFVHAIRLLHALPAGSEKVESLNERFRNTPRFGASTIRRFSTNASEMKKMAARDFEDLLQCSIPAFEDLFEDNHNTRFMKLLYRAAEWHALAKLRMHTDLTLNRLEKLTVEFGRLMREFRDQTCAYFDTVELPREAQARVRRQGNAASHAASGGSQKDSSTSTRKRRLLNLLTYKFHALGDYVKTIRLFGTTDSYSTQIGELAHRLVKKFYALTNKRQAAAQIGKRYRRERMLNQGQPHRRAQSESALHRRKKAPTSSHAHHVAFSASQTLDEHVFEAHHQITTNRDHPISVTRFLQESPLDPAKKNFYPKLQDHLLSRVLGRKFDGDDKEDLGFTDEDRNTIRLVNGRMYASKTMRINYTTYDVRRDSDMINPRTDHCMVMLHSPETAPGVHPYWYAQVLGIFHAQVLHIDYRQNQHSSQPQHMEFLWVRWFGSEPGYRSGVRNAKLPKIGFVPASDDMAFGFLDPSLLIRACHLIPSFAGKKTTELLDFPQSMGRKVDCESDWTNYYVNIFVDRDMFMRYFPGGGVGHSSVPDDHELDEQPEGEDSDNTQERCPLDYQSLLDIPPEFLEDSDEDTDNEEEQANNLSEHEDNANNNGSDNDHSDDDSDDSELGADDGEGTDVEDSGYATA
ncbi:hypothetical protein F5880DRAFT_1618922 [Lentinula raphanica]|nr:hypothetical protein F5880DRAFT_1618922 [Lentinula raphanica]